MISIVIPLYNKEKQIVKTIQSVLIQTLQDFEIVIVNDGSTDNSVAEVEKIADARIRLIHQQNAGVSAARNKGIAEASYELIAFLDADDEWKPEYLETQYALYEKYPECSVYACNYELRYDNAKVSNTIIRKLPFQGQDGVLSNYFEVASSSHPPLWTSAVMVRKEVIQVIGGFLLNATLGEDLITWAKLACYYSIAYSKETFAIYNFRTQKQLVTPRRAPDKIDLVGEEYTRLFSQYKNPDLLKTIVIWHKMRMVTFVRLNMRKEAKNEYNLIKQYIRPTLKIKVWIFLNYLPNSVCRFILLQAAKIRK